MRTWSRPYDARFALPRAFHRRDPRRGRHGRQIHRRRCDGYLEWPRTTIPITRRVPAVPRPRSHDAMHAIPPLAPQHDAVRVRIGINSGTALVGNVGSTERLSYIAIGDAVNFASRLVGVAKDKGVEIVLSGETLERADGRLDARSLGKTVVRGKSQPVPIFTLDRKSPPI
ncbi:adenylate/guanylate cyclase domain-containing protein [Rhizobium leguminosarum]|uniref:adenylate/guanylate cyclase domain-containing protein n=2 Tax=Rhizobium leguminosarum TaxID=384 RepID=UPI0021BBE294|nr:adenylate/guanylate cyclase domain-containing protein [Rhizobium leguminosarum]